MADVEASVEISVEGAGSLRDAAEAARNLASALKDAEGSAGSIGGAFESAARSLSSLRNDAEEAARALASVRNAGGELGDVAAGAESAAAGLSQMRDDATEAEAAFGSLVAAGPDIADIAAFAEQDAAALGHLRDEAVEAEAAVDSLSGSGAGLAGDAAGADAYAAALGHVRDNAAEAVAASKASAAGIPGSWEKTVAEVKGAMAFMEQGETAMFSKVGAQQFTEVITKDADALQILGAKVKGVKTGLDDLGDTAESRLSKLNLAQDFLAGGEAAGAWEQKVRSAWQAVGEAGPAIDAGQARISGLDAALAGGGDAAAAWSAALSGAGADIEGMAQDAEEGEGALSGLAGSLSDAAGSISPLTDKITPMSGAIAGLIGLVGGLGPAIGTAVVGGGVALGGFAALAVPTIAKIISSYEAVSQARKTWTQAEQVAKLDPTKSNIADAATDAAKLKAAYADVPASIRPVLSALSNVQSQYTSMAKAFRPEVLKVTGDGLSLLAEGMSQFLKPAANLGGSLLDKGIKNLQSFIESPGAVKTFNDLLKETPKALSSVGSLASSTGKFLGDAFGGEGLKGSESFIKTFGSLLKTIGPSVGTGVKGLATGLQDVMGAVQKGYPDLQKAAGALASIEKLNFGNLKSGLGNLGTALGPLEKLVGLYDKLPKVAQSGVMGSFAKSFEQEVPGYSEVLNLINTLDKASKTPAPSWIPKFLTDGKAAVSAPVTVKPDIKTSHLDVSALQAMLSGKGLPPLAVHVKTKVIPEGHVDPQALEASLGAKNAPPLTVPVKPVIAPDVQVNPRALQASLSKLQAGGTPTEVPATAKVNKTDTSGLKSSGAQVPATAKVDKVDSSSVAAAAKNVQIHGVTVNLSDAKLSGLGALSGSMSQAGQDAGKAFDSGVESGISSGAGGARAAASTVVNDVRGALSPLGGDGNAAGAALAAGLAAGIRAGTGAAVAAATAMANAVTAAVRAAHATQSPSKVFKGIAADDVAGLVLGLQGGKSQVQTAAQDMAAGVTKPFTDSTITTTITKLQDDITKALKAGHISPLQETEYSAALAYDNKRLMSLAKQRAAIETKIQAADQLYTSVVQATVAGANVATISGTVVTPFQQAEAMDTGTSSASATPSGPSSIQAGLKQYLSQTKQFRSDIVKLKKEGLDETSIQQLLQAGVTTGLPAAKMMLSGGQAGVQEIAKLQKQIGQAAKQLGVTGANASYESGSQIGKGLAEGLKGELSGIEDAIKSLAKSIVTEIKDDLKIKSPSQVAFDIGAQFAAGMAGGIKNGTPMVALSGKALAQAAAAGAATLPMLGAGAHTTPMALAGGGHTTPMATAGGGGSQTGEIHIHLEVGGTELANVVQKFSLQKARRNTATGLKLAGRGV